MARNIMRAFKMDEISAVDRPAQAHAKATILKRDFTTDERQNLADKDQAMPDGSYPIASTSDLKNAVQAFGRAKNPDAVKAHIIRRARALGATDSLPADWGVSKGEGGPGMPDDVKKQVEDLTAKVTELTTKVADVEKERDALKAEAEYQKAKANCPPDEKEMMDNMDEENAKKFLALTPEQRKAEIAKRKSGDESVVIEGQTIFKSKVGPEMFAVMKAQAKKIADTDSALKKAQEEAVHASFVKMAQDNYSHLPGTDDQKAKVLSHLGKLEGELAEVATKMLTAGEGAMKSAFSKLGHGGGRPGAGDPNEFEKKVSEIIARDKCSRTVAMQKARQEFPDIFKAYQGLN